MGLEGIGRGFRDAMVALFILGLLAGVAIIGLSIAIYKWFPWTIRVIER